MGVDENQDLLPPAAVFPLPPFLALISWGAESVPRKNFGDPLMAALIRASLSVGHFAT